MLPTKMHMIAGVQGVGHLATAFINEKLVPWKRATLCGKYLRLELTTRDWAKVECKMCFKVKEARDYDKES